MSVPAIQRLGSATKPFAVRDRLTTSISTCLTSFASGCLISYRRSDRAASGRNVLSRDRGGGYGAAATKTLPNVIHAIGEIGSVFILSSFITGVVVWS
jgi:hypothetical protein